MFCSSFVLLVLSAVSWVLDGSSQLGFSGALSCSSGCVGIGSFVTSPVVDDVSCSHAGVSWEVIFGSCALLVSGVGESVDSLSQSGVSCDFSPF